jgi:1A family penicillin-binding protein
MASPLARASGRFRTWLEPAAPQARKVHERALLAAVGAITVLSVVVAAWTIRYAVAIHRLGRGIGDTVFLGADGKPWFRLDEHRRDVAIADIAPALRNAVVAVEDHRFYLHPGVDPVAVGRAVLHNVRERSFVEGGSTLTQQLARTIFLSNARTAGRKAKEAALALMMEQRLRKNQILELYLNRVYMGSGRYGVESMSRAVFGKPAKSLSLAESAYLAGLIRAPSALSPWSNHQRALERSHTVLTRMRQERYITPEEEDAARRARLRIVSTPPPIVDAKGGYAKEYLRDEFRERFGKDHPPDWTVHTTFVPALQELAESSVAYGLRTLRIPDLQAALVAVDPRTGDLLALVGGSDALATPYNRAVRSRRQPGSAFKPIVYAAALETLGYTPATILVDSPLSFTNQWDGSVWSPQNYDGAFLGPIPLRKAVEQSRNIPAVRTLQAVGLEKGIEYARRLGLAGELPPYLPIALGAGEATLTEMTAAFATFANQGLRMKPFLIERITDRDGNVIEQGLPRATDALRADTAFILTSLLRGVAEHGTAARARRLRRPIAGKTGTTNDFTDAWFIGYEPSLAAGVWVGFDEKKDSLGRGETGADAALPIWMEFWQKAMASRPIEEFSIPGNVVFVPVDEMGHPGVPGVPGVHMEAFVAGTEPKLPELPPEPTPAAQAQGDARLSAPGGSPDTGPGPDRR